MNVFSLPAQCCDATHYLSLGEMCAATGDCYHSLRPMGAVYWFSLPYRMGWDPSILIALHTIFAIISIALSVIAMRHIITKIRRYTISATTTRLLTAGSLLIHAIFLMPTFNITLTDTPANLLFLIAVWLIIIGTERQNFLLMALAGLCLGLSTWLRVFFYYPVVLIAIISCFFYIHEERHKVLYSSMLACLLPLAIQISVTAQHTSLYSFLDPSKSTPMMAAHLGNPVIGYDTLDDGHPVSWTSSCGDIQPLTRSIPDHDYHSIACLLIGRINFYLGSYGVTTYHIQTTDHLRKIDVKDFNRFNTTQLIDPSNLKALHTIVSLNKAGTYEFHAEIWNDHQDQHILEFFITRHGSKSKLSNHIYLLSPTPNHASIVFRVEEPGDYDMTIYAGQPDPDSEAGKAIRSRGIVVNKAPFYVRHMAVYEDTRLPVRYWSPMLLVIHLLVLVCSIAILWQLIRMHTKMGLYIVTLLVTTSGMALVIVPEQRFVIAPMITIWIFFFTWIATILPSIRSAPTTEKDHA